MIVALPPSLPTMGRIPPSTPTDAVAQHYAPAEAALDAVLADLLSSDARLTTADLADTDQFHSGGADATRLLAQRAGIAAADRVLDIGGGFGGPARLLAEHIGCYVTVVDLTDAYLRVGQTLTERTGLTDHVRFQQGNALDIPFADGSFDVVWTQHASMNIADKTRLYAQIHRVLRVGGRLALHEVAAGSGEPLHLPVPFAQTEATSFLMSPQAFRATVAAAGFRELIWEDISEWTAAWFRERQQAQQNPSPGANGLGLLRLLGPNAGVMARNFARNVLEGRLRVVQAVFERR